MEICNYHDESKVINKDIGRGEGEDEEEDDDVPLPGFRFHPTDEELVSFYLTRKVEKKSFSIQLIKQIDIYKYDPWDLPKASNIGDKEWYFFCKRGRKYRNSLRPNRVTGSGFWKATGIDKPIYSSTGDGGGRDCIGLKKSLVYYRGSAGKGTKTDWMMHEFRLPGEHDKPALSNRTDLNVNKPAVTQEAAEVWTLSRIFKRNVKYRKCIPDLSAKPPPVDSSSSNPPCSSSSNFEYSAEDRQRYVSFNTAAPAPVPDYNHEMKPNFSTSNGDAAASEVASYYTNNIPADFFLKNNIAEYWDELSSVVDLRAAANTDFLI